MPNLISIKQIQSSQLSDFVKNEIDSLGIITGDTSGVNANLWNTGHNLEVNLSATGGYLYNLILGESGLTPSLFGYITTGNADLRYAHLTGNENVGGQKTFTDLIVAQSGILNDLSYWSGSKFFTSIGAANPTIDFSGLQLSGNWRTNTVPTLPFHIVNKSALDASGQFLYSLISSVSISGVIYTTGIDQRISGGLLLLGTGTGNILTFTGNDQVLSFFDSQGKFGFGATTPPISAIDLRDEAGFASVTAARFSNNAASANEYRNYKSRGTRTGVLPLQSGDLIGGLEFYGNTVSGGASTYLGSNLQMVPSSVVRGYVDGTTATGILPGAIVFSTVGPTGGALTDRLKVDAYGNLIPLLTQTYSLGSPSNLFLNLYVNYLRDVASGIAVDSNNRLLSGQWKTDTIASSPFDLINKAFLNTGLNFNIIPKASISIGDITDPFGPNVIQGIAVNALSGLQMTVNLLGGEIKSDVLSMASFAFLNPSKYPALIDGTNNSLSWAHRILWKNPIADSFGSDRNYWTLDENPDGSNPLQIINFSAADNRYCTAVTGTISSGVNPQIKISSQKVNFKATGNYVFFTVPANHVFMIDSMETITTDINTPSAPPSICFGNSTTSGAYQAANQTISNSQYARHIYANPQDGVAPATNIGASVCVPSTAVMHSGIFIYQGYLLRVS